MKDPANAAFEREVLPHLDDAYTLARYLLRDEHDAQDAVQEASLRAWRYLRTFAGDDSRAWFLTIVRNCCHTWHAKQRRSTITSDAYEREAAAFSASRSADAAAIESSERAFLQQSLGALPLELREVLVLRELNDLSYREISTIIEAPIGTVMSRLSRARERLSRILTGAREAS